MIRQRAERIKQAQIARRAKAERDIAKLRSGQYVPPKPVTFRVSLFEGESALEQIRSAIRKHNLVPVSCRANIHVARFWAQRGYDGRVEPIVFGVAPPVAKRIAGVELEVSDSVPDGVVEFVA